jgi:GNAT superfamily N-acetyltransferase
MNLKNLLTLTVRVQDFNVVAHQPDLLSKLRELTLSPYSGLNCELNRMLSDIETRPVNCQVLLGYRFRKLVAWGILSKETTDFHFAHSSQGFNADEGLLFQVFVDPSFRRQGIASELYKKAQQLTNGQVLHVCPWDERSVGFYTKFSDVEVKWL